MSSTKIRLAAFIAVLALVLCTAGCSEKTPLSPEEFRAECEEIGFTVTGGDSAEELGITKLLAAKYSGFVLNYSSFSSADMAKGVFDEIVGVYERNNSTVTMSLSTTYGSHEYRHFTAGDTFYVVSRVENTLIYCTADKSQKDGVIEVLRELGYK